MTSIELLEVILTYWAAFIVMIMIAYVIVCFVDDRI